MNKRQWVLSMEKLLETKIDLKEGHHRTNLSNATNFPNLYVVMYIRMNLRVKSFPLFESFFSATDTYENIGKLE